MHICVYILSSVASNLLLSCQNKNRRSQMLQLLKSMTFFFVEQKKNPEHVSEYLFCLC